LPVRARVTVAPASGLEPLGDYLAEAGQGTAAPPALIAIPVHSPEDTSTGPVPGAGASGLDAYLGVSAAQVIASAEMSGRAGETTQTVIRLGTEPCTVVFLGVGDASPGALRRAGAVLARRLPAGRRGLEREWHAFRCALYSPRPTTGPSGAGLRRPPECSPNAQRATAEPAWFTGRVGVTAA